jgi:membrane-associated HD superfamily phosphohydrolase
MICDGVESGVRSLKKANEERVREFIDKLIRSRAEDRQFDECELTLKELDIIEEVLTKRIMTTLHTRVAYPEKAHDSQAENIIHISGGQE